MGTGPFFVGIDTGSLVRVKEVDDSYAYIETLLPAPASYAMPLAEYDHLFVQRFKPARPADLAQLAASGYRPPLNAPSDWR